MDLLLKGKTALVTGASQGIGRAIAVGLAAEGARLAIVARRKELLEQVAETVVAKGGTKPALIVADVMEPDSGRTIAGEALAALGRIEILVNSAGGSRPIPVDAPDSIWDEAMMLNFTRLRQLTHAVLPSMTEHRWGRIVHITGKSEPEKINASFSAKGHHRQLDRAGADHVGADPAALSRGRAQGVRRARDPGRPLRRARGAGGARRVPRLAGRLLHLRHRHRGRWRAPALSVLDKEQCR
jgi:hypothetical protein